MYDALDLKIIELLLKDGRMPFSDIAKILGSSPALIQIRFNKLKESGVILGTSLVIDSKKCKIRSWAHIAVKALETEAGEVVKYIRTLETSESTLKIFQTFGRFNIVAVILSKELLQVYKLKQYLKAHPSVLQVNVCMNIGPFVTNFDSLDLPKELEPH